MSILLSLYHSEGIVFAADKNVTYTGAGQRTVAPDATKVKKWPSGRAVVGYVGHGSLGGKALDEWMEEFIQQNLDFQDMETLAESLRAAMEQAYSADFPSGATLPSQPIIVHLGGFDQRSEVWVPTMYHIRNHKELLPTGGFRDISRTFDKSNDMERDFSQVEGQPNPLYPSRVRELLAQLERQGVFQWYNNGASLAAFNMFKEGLWMTLAELRKNGYIPDNGLQGVEAFAAMAVEMLGSFYRYHAPEPYRAVGGGAEYESIPWPTQ